jgi:hypothetical protein
MMWMSILTIGIVSMILITSQSPSAFAGFTDEDGDEIQMQETCSPETAAAFQCDPDDTDPCVPNPHSVSCNPIEDIEDVIVDVVELVGDDEEIDITEGQTNAILGKLEQAVDKIESDNLNAAINSMEAFINQINAFINSGQLDPDAGGILIVAAEGIIETLNAM